MGDRTGPYRNVVGRPKRRSLGRPRRKLQDNIKMDLQEMGWGEWNGFRTGIGCGLEPSGSITCMDFLTR